jgi:hypothetical protein
MRSTPSDRSPWPAAWPRVATAIVVVSAATIGVAAPGCGSSTTTVEGLVTIGGRPVETGWIRFNPAAGDGPTAGAAIKQGRYRAAVVPGGVRVSLQGYQQVGEERPHGDPSAPLVPIMEPLLPSDDLGPVGEKTLAPGRNTLDFAL